MNFGEKLKELRELYDYTQGQVAYKLNLTHGTIAHWESGRRKPSYEDIGKLAEIFDVTTDYLIGLTTVPDGEVITKVNVMTRKVPVYGSIPAGTPFEAIQTELDDICVPDQFSRKKDLFGLKIDGESMNKVLPNGSIGIFEKTCHLENGQIGAIMVNGYDATVKKFYRLTDSVLLEPVTHCEGYSPTIIKDGDEPVSIIGKLIWYCADYNFK